MSAINALNDCKIHNWSEETHWNYKIVKAIIVYVLHLKLSFRIIQTSITRNFHRGRSCRVRRYRRCLRCCLQNRPRLYRYSNIVIHIIMRNMLLSTLPILDNSWIRIYLHYTVIFLEFCSLTTNDVSKLYSYVKNGFYIKMYAYRISVRILVTNTVVFDHVAY